MVGTSAQVRGTTSLEASSGTRAAIWTSASKDRGTLCGSSVQDRKHLSAMTRGSKVAGGTLGDLAGYAVAAQGARQHMPAGGEACLLPIMP